MGVPREKWEWELPRKNRYSVRFYGEGLPYKSRFFFFFCSFLTLFLYLLMTEAQYKRIKKINNGIPKEDRKVYEKEFSERMQNIDDLNVDHDAKKIAETVNIKQFDFDRLNLDSAVLVVGKRRYGKSVWSQWLLSKIWQYFPDGGYCFTRTKFNYFWSQHFPYERIYEGMNWDVILDILERQKQKWENIVHRKTYNDGSSEEFTIPYIVIVLDDIISNKKDMRHSELLMELMFSGRHYKIFIIINSQDIKGIGPDTRQNFDLIACTYQTQERQIETIKDDFGDYFKNNKVFREVIKKYTQDYNLLVIDQTTAHFNLDDVFFFDKAEEEPEDFQIGDDQFWQDCNCDWEKQVKIYKNIPKLSKEEWKEKADDRWKINKYYADLRKKYLDQKNIYQQDESNQIDFGNRAQKKDFLKRNNAWFEKSAVQQAKEMLNKVVYKEPNYEQKMNIMNNFH